MGRNLVKWSAAQLSNKSALPRTDPGICILVLLYIARQIPVHLRCTILLHLIDICVLPCICLWQISQMQTCLSVIVGPGFVSTSPAL